MSRRTWRGILFALGGAIVSLGITTAACATTTPLGTGSIGAGGQAAYATNRFPVRTADVVAIHPADSPKFLSGTSKAVLRRVTSSTIVQAAPFAGSVTVGTAFSGQVNVTGTSGEVTFTTTASSPDLSVSSKGAVTAPATDPVGTYSVSGTDSDGTNSGYWGFTLSVIATPAAPVVRPTVVVSEVVPEVDVVAVRPWTLAINQHVHLRIHLFGRRGTVLGAVKLEFDGKTLCAPKLVHGVAHCTVSSSKLGRGRHELLLDYVGSGFYKPDKHVINVYVH